MIPSNIALDQFRTELNECKVPDLQEMILWLLKISVEISSEG